MIGNSCHIAPLLYAKTLTVKTKELWQKKSQQKRESKMSSKLRSVANKNSHIKWLWLSTKNIWNNEKLKTNGMKQHLMSVFLTSKVFYNTNTCFDAFSKTGVSWFQCYCFSFWRCFHFGSQILIPNTQCIILAPVMGFKDTVYDNSMIIVTFWKKWLYLFITDE